jgi:glycosyltransferase involved in cell wall biosynthesis
VVNLHFTPGLLDHGTFFPAVPPGVPLVWRLPEMWPFTGGCHYDNGCGRFTQQCGACPQLGSDDPNDLSHRIWLRKRDALRRLPAGVHVAAPSNWIACQAGRSSLFAGYPVTVMPNGLDTEEWAPLDRQSVRQALRIPPEAKVVLFAADDTRDPRKGFGYAAEAVRGLRGTPGLLVVTVGLGQPSLPCGVPLLNLGNIRHDCLMRLVYNAADVFVMPSVQESFGQTVVESMACGTPVVAFATGGCSTRSERGGRDTSCPWRTCRQCVRRWDACCGTRSSGGNCLRSAGEWR